MDKQDKSKALQCREMLFNRLPELRDIGMVCVPNQRFWDFYRANKEMFTLACISVFKKEHEWVIVAHEYVDREEAQAQKIQTMLNRHYTVNISAMFRLASVCLF